MGICSASEIFQHEIEKVLNGLKGAKNLIDDIFVWGKDKAEHDERLYVLERLQERGVRLNPEKCKLKRSELEFYGMQFTAKGIRVTDEKIKALSDAPLPKTKAELRSFLGLASYCSSHIPCFADHSNLLRQMTHKHARMTWTEANLSQMAFLQQALTTNCLGYFNKQWNTVLETDASPIGASSVLYQWNPEDKKERKVIGYWSKAFSD